MLKRILLRFVQLFIIVNMALVVTGCGASYEIVPRASGLPSQAEMDRLAVPADLLAKLNRILAESHKTAENERPDPRYIAQSAGRFTNVEQKLVFALLQWGADKYVEAKQPAKAPEPAPVVAAKPLTREDPRVQVALGAVGGAALGAVPFGSVGADVAIELHILPNGTYWAQVGRACGEMAVGLGQIAVACTGVGAGIGMSGTGGGAVVGIPLVAESLVIGYNGLLTTANGFRHAQQLAQEGPPSAPDVVTPELLRPPRKPPPAPAPVAAAPPPKPAAPAPAPVAVKPSAPAAPAQTRTTTRNRTTGVTESHSESGTTTTSRPKKAPTQAGADVKPESAKRGPKTDPDAPHNAAVRKEREKLEAEGNVIVAGGQKKPEQLVKTQGGKKIGRRPDIIYQKPGELPRGRNVGKTNADGTPVKREQEALDDLNKHSDTPTDFVPYDR